MSNWNDWEAGSRATAAEFVRQANTLLAAVLERLPQSERVRTDLLTGLSAALNTEGREAVLALAGYESDQDHRGAIARQARTIGRSLAALAAVDSPVRPALSTLRSHCEGHVWTEAAAAHLLGSPEAPIVMQLYNEWLHQLVLLRDALLAYQNWENVELSVDSGGLRRFSSARHSFLAELLTRNVRHTSLVRLAAAAVTDDIVQDAYGFQTETATVLPAVVSGSAWTAARTLLVWQPARIVDDGNTVAFVAADADYLETPRTLVGSTDLRADSLSEVTLEESGRDHRGVRLSLSVRSAVGSHSVDLGQALRGHRYAYTPDEVVHQNGREDSVSTTVSRHSAYAILSASGLVEFPPGIHVVEGIPDVQVGLLLLGRIVPHNTILRENQTWSASFTAGKAGPPRVVLDAPARN